MICVPCVEDDLAVDGAAPVGRTRAVAVEEWTEELMSSVSFCIIALFGSFE